jgi:hypothetical protein
MNEVMEKIKYGILDLFPEIGIPNYDSMAAVNLQTFLEENFPLKVSLDILTAEMPLGELVAYIGRYVKNRN